MAKISPSESIPVEIVTPPPTLWHRGPSNCTQLCAPQGMEKQCTALATETQRTEKQRATCTGQAGVNLNGPDMVWSKPNVNQTPPPPFRHMPGLDFAWTREEPLQPIPTLGDFASPKSTESCVHIICTFLHAGRPTTADAPRSSVTKIRAVPLPIKTVPDAGSPTASTGSAKIPPPATAKSIKTRCLHSVLRIHAPNA